MKGSAMSKLQMILAFIKAIQPLLTELGPLVKQFIEAIHNTKPQPNLVGAAPVDPSEVASAHAALCAAGMPTDEATRLLTVA